MHLHEAVGWDGPMTHRQFLSWNEWLSLEWNKPSRTDYYLMQIAADVRRPNLKKAAQRKLELKHLRIPFVRQDAVVTKAQAQMRADKSKEMWLKIFPNIVKKEVPAPGV